MRIKKMVHGVTFGMVIAMMLGLLVIPQNTEASEGTIEPGDASVGTENCDGHAVIWAEDGYGSTIHITDFNPSYGDDNGGALAAGGQVLKVEQNGAFKVYKVDQILTTHRTKTATDWEEDHIFNPWEKRKYEVNGNFAKTTEKYYEGNQVIIETEFYWFGIKKDIYTVYKDESSIGGYYTATFSANV